MYTIQDKELYPGRQAILASDPFNGRYGNLVGAYVTITRYGGFEDVGFKVDGIDHGSVVADEEIFIACDENGRPVTAAVERHYSRIDHRREYLQGELAKLDAEREQLTALVAGALDR